MRKGGGSLKCKKAPGSWKCRFAGNPRRRRFSGENTFASCAFLCGYVVNGSCRKKYKKTKTCCFWRHKCSFAISSAHIPFALSCPVMQFLFSLAHNPLWQMCRYCYYYFSLSSSAPCVYGRWRVVVVSNKWISGNHQGISSSLNNTTFFRSGKSNCWQNFDIFLCALFSLGVRWSSAGRLS